LRKTEELHKAIFKEKFLYRKLLSLMGLWEGHLSSLFPLKGTRRNLDDSPLFGGSLATPTAPQMRAESMRGTMSPLGGNPRPSRVEEVSVKTDK